MTKTLTPFVKWAGGKRQLISEIEKRLPKKYHRYFEPFIGGGAVFFHLQNPNVVINDISEDLINVYKVVKMYPYELINKLNNHENNHKRNPKIYYYSVREMDRLDNWDEVSNIDKAARFIYLNKSCFNGLYRVNSKGYFNVPFNQKQNVTTYNKDNLVSISEYLNNNNIEILYGDFERAVKDAKQGDFIYFDPPYDLLKDDTFDSYTKGGFGREGQVRLSNLFKKLSDRGCYVMLSNHNTPLVNDLYKDYNIDVINVRRMINSNAKKRTGEEVIIYNDY